MKPNPPPPLRGQVFFVDFPRVGRKPIVVVSNNQRNAALMSVLGARITSAPKPPLPTIVELGVDEPVRGRVLCDDVVVIPKSRLGRRAGGLSPRAMFGVDRGLGVALGLSAYL